MYQGEHLLWKCNWRSYLDQDGILLLGYVLGERLEGSVIITCFQLFGLIILLSVIPVGLEILRERKENK
jgi:hypothetical protein